MGKRITIIQGHPDGQARHFCHALADEYAKGCEDGGHTVRRVDVAMLEIPVLRTKEDFERGQAPDFIRPAEEAISWADHLVIVYPLWLGSMPALLKAFFEQVFRPGVAFQYQPDGTTAKKFFAGKSARVVVTMGMPAWVYRWWYRAHSLKSLQRNILQFCGIKPAKATLIGNIESMTAQQRASWLDEMRGFGERGQ
ncbi:MAG TPA: NAD(P)H-dependent oxidoreductase [Nitrospira sp.]|nr:flavodoxin family protein [Nitrospira sp. NTP1]HQR14687.1 NAD(P)H-dependent oxidoreductase [Nitrospira sp.]HQV12923.1 NAD(P)H-dependent oxidoreductase [Nitrospira sp.]